MAMPHAELEHELEHLKLGTSVLGYDRKAVDMLLERLAPNYEELWIELAGLEALRNELRATRLERDELRLRVAELQNGSSTSRELAALVRNTITSAQHGANEIRADARHEAGALRSRARREPTRAPDGGRTGVRPMEVPGQPVARSRRQEVEHAQLDAACRRLTEELERLRVDLYPPAGPAETSEPPLAGLANQIGDAQHVG